MAHLVLALATADPTPMEDWPNIIIRYLAGEEPEDPAEAKRLRCRARNYYMVSGELYKGGVCAPFLRCISQKGVNLLYDIH